MQILIHLGWLLIATMTAYGQGHYSLVVKVVNPHDVEVDAAVTVKEADGRVIKKENEVGGVKFCDLAAC